MEMVWEGSRDLGTDGDLFTGLIRIMSSLLKNKPFFFHFQKQKLESSGVLWDNYGPPPGFCWDLICNDAPIMDPTGFLSSSPSSSSSSSSL